ncbi:MAG TPA: hypothetical protein VJK08_02445, partial [Patescibacteria group bacterium]|nr:hypothetical protein [Patescibacteria group bacterium]
PYGDNEAIIGFIGGIRRVSDDDSDLQIFPEDLTKKKRTTSSIMINGVKMGRRKMVKYMKDQQKLSEMK